VRLRKQSFTARVSAQTGDHPIVIGYGMCTFEATIDEARALVMDIADAIVLIHEGTAGGC
jgi:hypothetical protein